ncbi:MAG: DNA topoisomerase IV subunit A [Candidatus Nanoarchaeia archaeon]|nr:DNA topoisomerase IV subunit A [Candidatus Nanoarchaeia archaeon]
MMMNDDINLKIKGVAEEIYKKIKKKEQPNLDVPLRSLTNVSYDDNEGYFKLLGKKKTRTLTASTIKTFAQSLRMMVLSKQLVDSKDLATKREVYYVSKNWGDAKFNDQPESDSTMDDVEAMLLTQRERMGFVPEEDGGAVTGKLKIIEKDVETGKTNTVDCTKFVSGAYNIPNQVEDLEFQTDAKFILAIETAGMFQRLVKHKYWEKTNCLLVSLKGVPSRACRRFIRRLSDEHNLPVYVFTDCDFYGFMNIYRTLKVGSGNAAHINKFFCVPKAQFIGLTPQDIIDYKLPTHKLKDVDVKRGKDALKNDPFVHHHKEWQKAIKQLNDMKVRAEQQALAVGGLNFVMEKYLPDKLKNHKTWLP